MYQIYLTQNILRDRTFVPFHRIVNKAFSLASERES